MRFNAELNNRVRGRVYEEVYQEMLDEIQAIQRQFPNERSIPRQHPFWKKKEELFDLVGMQQDGTLEVAKPAVRAPTSTFRSRKAGSVRHQEDIGEAPKPEEPPVEIDPLLSGPQDGIHNNN